MSNLSVKAVVAKFVYGLALLGGLIHMMNAITGRISAFQMRPLHLAILGVLAFVTDIVASDDKRLRLVRKALSAVMMVFIVLGCGYFGIYYNQIAKSAGYVTNEIVIFGILLIISVLFLTWRTVGAALVVVASVFILYALLGQFLPGVLGHRGYSFQRVVNFLYTNGNGIFGVPIDTSARYLVLFMILGEFIDRSGTSKLFMIFADTVARRSRGGAAKSAVVASALFGTMSGTPIANVMVTGSFTIPMMKKSGIEPEFAAGVEATASTGGLIMPPMMGAGAFVMAELMGIGYEKIMVAAVIPAILYYLSIYFAVDFYAARHSINKITEPRDPDAPLIRDYIHTIIPLGVFLALVITGSSVFRSAFIAILLTPLVAAVRRETRMSVRDILNAIVGGMKSSIGMGAACACAGIIVGVISLTGFGFSFSELLKLFANMPIVALFITMAVCIIMGMGMPAVASYLITATIAAPTLIEMGFLPIAVHMFIFYYSCFSSVTPPVALASYAAAGLADTNTWRTGYKAFQLALVAFLAPYFFVYSPGLLGQTGWAGVLATLPIALIGVYVFVCGVQGYLFGEMKSFLLRVPLMLSGCLMIVPGWQTDAAGVVLGLLVLAAQRYLRKRALPATGVH